ncbi:CGNR zinc finger domain-containing protein, partial [Streptomyces sp. NRRL WC-3549]|uniref:CGNR zinc finger domain-containing protein n=1 Tax=Streptomyces sp. NRRL WC-3549 TaxID=1463925 RepID=UPI0004C63425
TAELLSGPDVPLLKECGSPSAPASASTARGARRQWCGMEPCGNRIKAAAHRAPEKDVRAAPSA